MDTAMALLRKELESLPNVQERLEYLRQLGWINERGEVRADLPESVYAGLLPGVPTEREEIEAKWKKLSNELHRLPSKKERVARLQQLGYFDGFHISPEVPEWTYEDADAGQWDTSRLQTETTPSAGRDEFLQRILTDPNELRTVAADLEKRGDLAAAQELRERVGKELERRFAVGKETLVFRRVLEGEHKNKWRVVAGGQYYVCEDPEKFSLDYASQKADAEDRNEDGIPSGELYRFTRKIQSGQLRLNDAPCVYLNLSLIAQGRQPLTPFEVDEFASDIRNRSLCDSAVLHSYEAAFPGSITPGFRAYLARLGQPLTLGVVQRAHETHALSRDLEMTKGIETEEPIATLKIPFTAAQLTPERIARLTAEEIAEIEADSELVELLSDEQLQLLADRRARMLRQMR